MANKQKNKAIRNEQRRQAIVAKSFEEGEKLRKKSANYVGTDSTRYKDWTPRQMEAWVSRVTGIKGNKGTNQDRRAGRSKGRYAKGQL